MYEIMKGISVIIRLFILPNPFEEIENGFLINMFIAEPIIHGITFSLVGIVYKRGTAPAIGSFLYLVVYWIIVSFIHGALAWL